MMSWPQLPYVAVDMSNKIVGYVLAKMEDDNPDELHGHVTSLAVLRTYRKMGIATKLMRASMKAMEGTFKAEFVSLHVRYTNRAAFTLYSQTLGFEINDIEKGYYADKEDAYDMRMLFERGEKKKQEQKEKADAKKKGGKESKVDAKQESKPAEGEARVNGTKDGEDKAAAEKKEAETPKEEEEAKDDAGKEDASKKKNKKKGKK